MMRNEERQVDNQAFGAETVTCPSCRAVLTAELRFCRMCGYRLGEGVEEYNETRRFDEEGGRVFTAANAPAGSGHRDPFAAQSEWGGAPLQPGAQAPQQKSLTSGLRRALGCCRTQRAGWWVWIVVAIAIMVAVGAGSTAFIDDGPPSPPRSFLGVDGLRTADGGGAFIEGIDSPVSPVERAGLLGGDVIVSFDKKPVKDAGDLREMLTETPPGTTVEVGYMRDGVMGTTTLTTGSREGYEGLRVLDQRPGGRGQLGVSDLDRVRVPGMGIYGVELGNVRRNRPADIAGLKDGDIVIEFNGKPVRTEGDLRLRIYEAVPNSTVEVVIVRNGERMVVPVKVGRSKDD